MSKAFCGIATDTLALAEDIVIFVPVASSWIVFVRSTGKISFVGMGTLISVSSFVSGLMTGASFASKYAAICARLALPGPICVLLKLESGANETEGRTDTYVSMIAGAKCNTREIGYLSRRPEKCKDFLFAKPEADDVRNSHLLEFAGNQGIDFIAGNMNQHVGTGLR